MHRSHVDDRPAVKKPFTILARSHEQSRTVFFDFDMACLSKIRYEWDGEIWPSGYLDFYNINVFRWKLRFYLYCIAWTRAEKMEVLGLKSQSISLLLLSPWSKLICIVLRSASIDGLLYVRWMLRPRRVCSALPCLLELPPESTKPSSSAMGAASLWARVSLRRWRTWTRFVFVLTDLFIVRACAGGDWRITFPHLDP